MGQKDFPGEVWTEKFQRLKGSMAKKRRRVDQAEECAKEEMLTSSSSRGECNGSHHTWWPGSSSIGTGSIGTIGSIGSIGTAKSCQLGPYDGKKTCQGWEGRS